MISKLLIHKIIKSQKAYPYLWYRKHRLRKDRSVTFWERPTFTPGLIFDDGSRWLHSQYLINLRVRIRLLSNNSSVNADEFSRKTSTGEFIIKSLQSDNFPMVRGIVTTGYFQAAANGSVWELTRLLCLKPFFICNRVEKPEDIEGLKPTIYTPPICRQIKTVYLGVAAVT